MILSKWYQLVKVELSKEGIISDGKIDEVGVIDTINLGSIKINFQTWFKITKSKNLIKLKKSAIIFFIFKLS